MHIILLKVVIVIMCQSIKVEKIILHTLFPFVHSARYLFVTIVWNTLEEDNINYETIFDFNELELGKQFQHFSCCNRHRSIFLECGHLFEYILLLHDNCLVPYVDVLSSLYRTIWYNRPNKMYCCLFWPYVHQAKDIGLKNRRQWSSFLQCLKQ